MMKKLIHKLKLKVLKNKINFKANRHQMKLFQIIKFGWKKKNLRKPSSTIPKKLKMTMNFLKN